MLTYSWEARDNRNDPPGDIYPEGMALRSTVQGCCGPFFRVPDLDPIFAVYVNQRPAVTDLAPSPGSITKVHRPRIAAAVYDPESDLTEANIALSLNGKSVRTTAFVYDASTDRLTNPRSAWRRAGTP